MKPQNFAADSSLANSVCHRYTYRGAHIQNCSETPEICVHLNHPLRKQNPSLSPALLGLALCAEPFRTCFSPPKWRLWEAAPLCRHPSLGRVVGSIPAAVPGVAELFHCSMAAAPHVFDVDPGNPVQLFCSAPGSRTAGCCLCFWHNIQHLPFPYTHAGILALTLNKALFPFVAFFMLKKFRIL